MQTIYIDVYFLINFTVDLLSLHLASRFTKIPVLARRILFAALIGGAYAAVLVFLPQNIFFFSVLTLFFGLLMMLISTRGVGVGRKIKFTAAFLFFQITIFYT